MKPFSLLFSFVLAVLWPAVLSVDNCHLRELDVCAASGAGAKSVPVSDAEIDKYCALAQEAKDCVTAFTNKCTTPLQKELIAYATESTEHIAQKFCKKGDDLRVGYLKHAPCLAKTQPDENKCVVDVEAALEKIEEAKFDDRISMACCTYARYQKCSKDIIEKACGKEAVEYGQVIIKMASANLADVMCQGFDANPVCHTLLPPSGTHPKGNGKSLVGKVFKAYMKS